MFFKIDEQTKHLVEEVSALSGIQREVIREVWEQMLFHWIAQISADPKKLHVLKLPFLGNLGIKYTGEKILEDGSLTPQVTAYVSLNESFERLVRDVYEDKNNVLLSLLDKKIDHALDSTLDPDTQTSKPRKD